MRYHFDKEKAQQKANRLDTDRRNQYRAVVFLWIATAALFGVSFFVAIYDLLTFEWLVALWGVGMACGIVTVYHTDCLIYPKSAPADVIFLQETQTRKNLRIRIRRRLHEADMVCLYAEAENGNVEEIELCPVRFQPNANYTVETFDVNQEIIYCPFDRKGC